ncbi:hypothetical protein ACLOJK_021051 [Asimina triloba]
MGRGVWKAFLGATAFVVFIGFLFVEIIANGGASASAATAAVLSAAGTSTVRSSMHFQPLPRGGPTIHPNMDPNFVSKRRVPNGPDPIHNSLMEESRQVKPTTRASLAACDEKLFLQLEMLMLCMMWGGKMEGILYYV